MAFALLSTVVWFTDTGSALSWRADLWQLQPWTLWTSALSHLSGTHLRANLLALAALALLGHALQADARAALAWLMAWPIVSLTLPCWPQITAYSGLSGLLHAGVGVLWAWSAVQKTNQPWSFVLLCGLGLKLLTEHAWSQPVRPDSGWDFAVVQAAHLSGALSGAAIGLLLGLLRRRPDSAHQRRG